MNPSQPAEINPLQLLQLITGDQPPAADESACPSVSAGAAPAAGVKRHHEGYSVLGGDPAAAQMDTHGLDGAHAGQVRYAGWIRVMRVYGGETAVNRARERVFTSHGLDQWYG